MQSSLQLKTLAQLSTKESLVLKSLVIEVGEKTEVKIQSSLQLKTPVPALYPGVISDRTHRKSHLSSILNSGLQLILNKLWYMYVALDVKFTD